MKIPTTSLFGLLCYAWNRPTLPGPITRHGTEAAVPQDLFAKLLHEGFSALMRRGLDREYREVLEDTRRPRGRLEMEATVQRALRAQGRIRVRYEELSRNVLQNRIIRSTIGNLMAVRALDEDLRGRLRLLAERTADVSQIEIRDEFFDRIHLHRNNAVYGLLLDVCRLVHRHLIPEGGDGSYRFRDFTDDDPEMGRLFEEAVRNFLRIEEPRLRVEKGHRKLRWRADRAEGAEGAPRLPEMELDITVEGPNPVIVEAKCVGAPFRDNALDPQHLRQIFAYLENYEAQHKAPAAGVLLYATDGEDFHWRYTLHQYPLRVRSVNLNRTWKEVDSDLRDFAGELRGMADAGPAAA